MVDVAQLVRAPVCGTGGREFESHLPPHYFPPMMYTLDCSQAVRHQTLTLACASSNLASPANNVKTFEKSEVLPFTHKKDFRYSKVFYGNIKFSFSSNKKKS